MGVLRTEKSHISLETFSSWKGLRIFQRSQENVCKEYHFRLDIMIEIGGEEEGSQEREGRPVRAVCLRRGLASRNYKEREPFRTRTPSFRCVCPSGALKKSFFPDALTS